MSVLVQVIADHPASGKIKPHVSAALGEQAAAELHSALLEDMLWRMHGSVEAEIWGNASAGKRPYPAWIQKYHLGFKRQTDGKSASRPGKNPDIRLEDASSSAFLRRRLPVMVITACPSIDVDLLNAMDDELNGGASAVMVPLVNGGVAALGLAVKNYQLFRGVDFKSKKAATQTLQTMFDSGIECAVFEPVQGADTVADVRKLGKQLDGQNDAELYNWFDQYL